MKGYTLVGELPRFTAKIEQLRAFGRDDGIEFDTADFGGVRTLADTERIMKYRADEYAIYLKKLAPDKTPQPIEVWRPIAPFGSSMHNYGAARDLKIIKHDDLMSEAECLRRLGEIAVAECGLRWGGNFKKRVDPPHFELAMTLVEAKALWEAQGMASL